MLGCSCCRCSKSIESLDLSKSYGDEVKITKREKLTNAAEAKSYKKLRLSSFIPESYFVNGQHMNLDCKLNQSGPPSTSQLGCLGEQTTKAKMITPSLSSSPASNNPETKPKLTYQPTLYEDGTVCGVPNGVTLQYRYGTVTCSVFSFFAVRQTEGCPIVTKYRYTKCRY